MMAHIERLMLVLRTSRRPADWGPAKGAALLLACGVLFSGSRPTLVLSAEPAAEGKRVLALAREAAKAVKTNLQTGTGEGTFRGWAGPDKELRLSGHFSTAFDGARQYFKVFFKPAKGERPYACDRCTVVCDGSDVFIGYFSERIHPLGAEGAVLRDKMGAVHAATLGLPLGLKLLAAGIFPLAPDEEYNVKVKKLPNGHFLGTYDPYEEGASLRENLEIAPEFGHQCILTELFVDGELRARSTAAFEQYGDLWYAKCGKSQIYVHGEHRETLEWKVDQFEPNAPVSSELFTLSALELPGGARIIDRRPPKGYRVTNPANPPTFEAKIYRLPYTKKGQNEFRFDE